MPASPQEPDMKSTIHANKPFDSSNENLILTADDYLESLRDGREIWYDGEKIKDITTHPAFKYAARSVARFYDVMHDKDRQDELLLTDSHGITTHKFFAPSYSSEELLAARSAIALSQGINYGWMGRTPDYKAAFMAHLADNSGFYDKPYQGNAVNWYKKYAKQCLHLNHVLVDPPVDRSKERFDMRDVYLSVDRDDDRGMYVSGAKMVATGSALTHATFVGMTANISAPMKEGRDEDLAIVFFADMDTKGLKMISRPSYEHKADSPFDAPLSARYDENDAVLVMEKAFIPWENVLIYRDVERCKKLYPGTGFFNRYNFQAAIRLAIKLTFTYGLFIEAAKSGGIYGFRGVQAGAGELISLRNQVWALTRAMCYDTVPCGNGVVPKPELAATVRQFVTNIWDRVRFLYETLLAGAPIYTVSSSKDLANEELRPTIDRYFPGTGMGAEDRIKLFKLVWDTVYSEFAGRHALYERNYSGAQEQQRLDVLKQAEISGSANEAAELVEKCMSDYDATGWVHEDWARA